MQKRTPSPNFQKHGNSGASLRGMQVGCGPEMHMADGGDVAPTSFKGLYNRAVAAMSNAHQSPIELRANRSVAPYPAPQPVAAPPMPVAVPASAPAPTGVQGGLDGMGGNSMQRREAAAGLADGGELPNTGLRGMYNGAVSALSNFHQSPLEVRANRAVRPAISPQPQPAPLPVMQPSAPAPIGVAGGLDGMGGGSMARREAAAGLQDGGDVPGRGEGDKIPAMYEPGEFVVSNDMLDAAPSLRGHLHGLRNNVLASQGRTPQEANANALRKGGVRAAAGGSWGDEQKPGVVATMFPGSTAVGRGFAEDADAARRETSTPAKLGQFGRAAVGATLAAPVALAHDVLRPIISDNPGEALSNLGRGIVNTAATAITGDSAPFTSPSAAPTARPVPANTGSYGPPVPAPSSITEPSLRTSTTTGLPPGVTRYDNKGQAPMFSNVAGAGDAPYRPAMSADDPGMQGIQARQDGRLQAALQNKQYNDEVAGAKAINSIGMPKEGFMRAQLRAQQENNRNANALTVRGQDLDYGAKLRGNQLAWATQQREQGNKDREFSADQGKTAFSQGEAGEKLAMERNKQMFIDPSTGKPDEAKAAEYTQFQLNGIADMKQKLMSQGRTAEANKLTIASLDPADQQAISRQWANRNASAQASGMMPGSGGHVNSMHPSDWDPVGVDSRTIGGDHIQFRNGSHASRNDLSKTKWYMPGAQGTSDANQTIQEAYDAQKRRTQGAK